MRRLVDLCLRRPRGTLLVAGVLTLAALALLFRLRPQTSLVAMFDPNNPSVVALERVVNEFPVAEELLVLASLPEDAPADRARLTDFADRLRERLSTDEARPLVANVRDRAGPEFRAFVEQQIVPNGLVYLDDAGRAEALRRLTPEGMAEQLDRTRAALAAPGPAAGALGRTLARDPLRLFELLQVQLAGSRLPGVAANPTGDGRFVSPDGRAILLRIDGAEPPGNLAFSQRLVAFVSDAIAESNADGLAVQTAGAYAVAAYDTGEIKRDSIVGTLTSIGGLALVVGLLYRRPFRLFLFAFTPVAVGILWGFGVYAIVSPTITPLAAVIGGALGGIGIDYPIHFLAHYDAERRTAANATEAARQTLARLGRPTFVAWLTSVIGFAAVALSPVGVLRDFALIGSLGLLGAGLATVTLLPAALVAFDRGAARPATPRFDTGRRLSGLLLGPTRGLFVATLTLAVSAGAWAVARGDALSLEYDLFALHPSPNPPLAAQAEIQKRMGLAGGTMFVLIEADDAEALVAKAHAVSRRLRSDAARAGGVVGSFGIDALLPDPANPPPPVDADAVVLSLNAALDDAGFRPDAFAEYAAFLRLLANAGDPPNVADLLKYPAVASLVLPRSVLDGEPATASVSVIHFDTELLDRAGRDAALAGVREALAGMEGVVATGAPALGSDIESAILRDLPREFGLAIALIGVTLALFFRSPGRALLALSPTLVSAVLLLWAMEAFGLRLNLVNGVLVPLLLGINVDYGIFAVVAARGEGDVRERLRAACGALVTCAATTSVGCGTLALTSVPAVRSLGILIVVGVVGCVVGTLGVTLPALLWRGDHRPGGRAGTSPARTG